MPDPHDTDPDTPVAPKRTKPEKRAVYRVHEALSKLEFDLHMGVRLHNHIPLEWSDLHRDRTEGKVKITTRVDSDIVKYLKSLGPGYQDRMNAILRAWVEAKAAAMIQDEARITEMQERAAARAGRPIWAAPDGTYEDPDGRI